MAKAKLQDMTNRNTKNFPMNRDMPVSPDEDTMTSSFGKDRSVSNADPSDNASIIAKTHRDPEPAMDPNDE